VSGLLLGSVLLSLTLCSPAQGQASQGAAARFQEATQAMREGKLEVAAEGFAEAAKANPAFAEAYFNLGLVREEQGRHAEAIQSFQKALLLKPRLHGANLFLGVAQFRLNHFDEAIAAMRKETDAYPKDPGAWMWLGVAQLGSEKNEDAAVSLDRAAKLNPKDTDILYHRGQAHLLVSRDSYTQMFKEDPKSWRVRQVLAQTAAEAERHDEAIAEYLQAIKLGPTQPGLHEELGTQYRSVGKFDEAEAAFRRELELDPHNVLATYKLGILEVERNHAAEGTKLIESAIKAKPNLVNADYNLGRAKMALGDDIHAVENLKLATTGNSDLDTVQQAWYQLGIVYRRLKRNDDARQAMATFQKLKDEEAVGLQQRMKKYTGQQNVETGETPPPPPLEEKP
jgi:tetratricopeptide (TPR) repeat protein